MCYIILVMNKTLSLTPVTNVADIKPNAEYAAEHNGTRYFGKFIDASVGTYYAAKHFVWNGSVFPQGIPFENLDAVYAVA